GRAPPAPTTTEASLPERAPGPRGPGGRRSRASRGAPWATPRPPRASRRRAGRGARSRERASLRFSGPHAHRGQQAAQLVTPRRVLRPSRVEARRLDEVGVGAREIPRREPDSGPQLARRRTDGIDGHRALGLPRGGARVLRVEAQLRAE